MENKTVFNGEQNCFTVKRKCRMKNENKKPCKMTDCIQVSYLKICHEKHFVKPCLITVFDNRVIQPCGLTVILKSYGKSYLENIVERSYMRASLMLKLPTLQLFSEVLCERAQCTVRSTVYYYSNTSKSRYNMI